MNKKDSVEVQKTSTAYFILEEISVFLKYLNLDNNFVLSEKYIDLSVGKIQPAERLGKEIRFFGKKKFKILRFGRPTTSPLRGK